MTKEKIPYPHLQEPRAAIPCGACIPIQNLHTNNSSPRSSRRHWHQRRLCKHPACDNPTSCSDCLPYSSLPSCPPPSAEPEPVSQPSVPHHALQCFVSPLRSPQASPPQSRATHPLQPAPALEPTAAGKRVWSARPSHPQSPSTCARRSPPWSSAPCLRRRSNRVWLACACACRAVKRSGDVRQLRLRHRARRGGSHGACLLELGVGDRVVRVEGGERDRRHHHHRHRRRRRRLRQTRRGLGPAQPCS